MEAKNGNQFNSLAICRMMAPILKKKYVEILKDCLKKFPRKNTFDGRIKCRAETREPENIKKIPLNAHGLLRSLKGTFQTYVQNYLTLIRSSTRVETNVIIDDHRMFDKNVPVPIINETIAKLKELREAIVMMPTLSSSAKWKRNEPDSPYRKSETYGPVFYSGSYEERGADDNRHLIIRTSSAYPEEVRMEILNNLDRFIEEATASVVRAEESHSPEEVSLDRIAGFIFGKN